MEKDVHIHLYMYRNLCVRICMYIHMQMLVHVCMCIYMISFIILIIAFNYLISLPYISDKLFLRL
jgi:hypothetical protein